MFGATEITSEAIQATVLIATAAIGAYVAVRTHHINAAVKRAELTAKCNRRRHTVLEARVKSLEEQQNEKPLDKKPRGG